MKRKQLRMPMYRAVLSGVVIALVISLILTGVFALGIYKESMREEDLIFIAPAIQLLSSFIGAFIAGKGYGQKYILSAAITGTGYTLILMVVSLLLFDCSLSRFVICLLLSVIGGVTAGFLCLAKRPTHRPKKQRL